MAEAKAKPKKKKPAKKKVGRPAFAITPEICRKAESLAAQGLTLEQTAHTLGISYKTLNEKRKDFSEFSEAIALGKAKGVATITNALFAKAKEGDVPAMKYYLNNRDNSNWKDRVESTNTHVMVNHEDWLDSLG
jgi:hypothetical protein